MSFQLSPEVDKNKIFMIQLNELEGRFDPLFYLALKNIKNNIIRKSKYRCCDLIKTCSINRGRFGHRPRNDPKFYGGAYPFIQIGDIVKPTGNNELDFIGTSLLNLLKLLTRSKV